MTHKGIFPCFYLLEIQLLHHTLSAILAITRILCIFATLYNPCYLLQYANNANVLQIMQICFIIVELGDDGCILLMTLSCVCCSILEVS